MSQAGRCRRKGRDGAAQAECLEVRLLLATHYYGFTGSAGTWSQAEQEAVSFGGHLVSITSQGEQDFINNNFVRNNPTFVFWTGLTDKVTEGTFKWSTGESLVYQNWNPGEPNNYWEEDYVSLNWHRVQRGSSTFGSWNDEPLRGVDGSVSFLAPGNPAPHFGIVEFNSRPANFPRTLKEFDPTPNLTPFKPNAWSDKIVVSTARGTSTAAAQLIEGQPLYVDWAVTNTGVGLPSARFSTQLLVDGVIKQTWTTDWQRGWPWTQVLDYALGSLPVGSHTIKIVTDSTNSIAERNETDNSFTKSITILPRPAPALQLAPSTQADSRGRFWIDTAPKMPKVTFQITNLPAGTPSNLVVTWTTSVNLSAGPVPGGKAVAGFSFSAEGGITYTPDFPTLAGGDLNVTAKFVVAGKTYTISTEAQTGMKSLKILGKNPTKAQVQQVVDGRATPAKWPADTKYDYHVILRKILYVETNLASIGAGGYNQFYRGDGANAGYPAWNTGGDNGVGITQVTDSPPKLSNVWNWRANLAAGLALFDVQKLGYALTYPVSLAQNQKFKDAVAAVNRNRLDAGKAALLRVDIPAWTPDQRVEVAIRTYNGAAGVDSLGIRILHEFELQKGSNGLLSLRVDEARRVGTAIWSRVPESRRKDSLGIPIGNPGYVDDVLAAPST